MSREPHRYHEDGDLFRKALAFTQAETGFNARLVEKDYYGSLLLVDPFRQAAAIAPIEVPVLSCREAYAEKLRAALSRREPAIRDFYDIDHGVRSGQLDTNDRRLVELVRSKLAMPGNGPIDLADGKRQALARQMQAQLRPVLRESDFALFDLDRAVGIATEIARAL